MVEPGELFSPKYYPVHLFRNKKNLIEEMEATRKMWAHIFKMRTTIEVRDVFMFLELEHFYMPDPEGPTVGWDFILWKVLYKEEIGWIEAGDMGNFSKVIQGPIPTQ